MFGVKEPFTFRVIVKSKTNRKNNKTKNKNKTETLWVREKENGFDNLQIFLFIHIIHILKNRNRL